MRKKKTTNLGSAVLAFIVLILASGSAAGEELTSLRERLARTGSPTAIPNVKTVAGTPLTLQVEPFNPFLPTAQVLDGDGVLSPSPAKLFRGEIAGRPGSLVVIGEDPQISVVILDGDVFSLVDTPGGLALEPMPLPETAGTFACLIEEVALAKPGRSSLATPRAPLAATPMIAMAFETDHELFSRLGSATAVQNYVGALAAIMSVVLRRDLGVDVRVAFVGIWSSSQDPWRATTAEGMLPEVEAYWLSNEQRRSVTRSTIQFLSGKSQLRGLATLGTLCRPDSVSVVSGLSGHLSSKTPVWDSVASLHELGHTLGSDHTHCYTPPVDRCCDCATEANCASQGGGPVPPGGGTLMSYCQLRPGWLANIRLVYGASGEPSQRVIDTIRSFIATAGCVGGCTDGAVNDSPARAEPIRGPGAIENCYGPDGERWQIFTAIAGRDARARLTPAPGAGRGQMVVKRTTDLGTEIGFQNSGDVAVIDGRFARTGSYYLKSRLEGLSSGKGTLTHSFAPTAPSRDHPEIIRIGDVERDFISRPGQVVWYGIDLGSGQHFQANVRDRGDLTYDGRRGKLQTALYDRPDGTRLAAGDLNENLSTNDARVRFDAPASGRYFLKIVGRANAWPIYFELSSTASSAAPPSAVLSAAACGRTAGNGGTLTCPGPSVSVGFDGRQSSPGSGSLTYRWDVGGTPVSSASTFNFGFGTGGPYGVSLTVTNTAGLTATASMAVVVTDVAPISPTADISATACGQTARNGGTLSCPGPPSVNVAFDGGLSTPGSGTLTSFLWDVAGTPLSFASSLNHTFGTGGPYLVNLTVANSAGLTATASVTIVVVETDRAPVAHLELRGCGTSAREGGTLACQVAPGAWAGIDLDASLSDSGSRGPIDYRWDLNSNFYHSNPITSFGLSEGSYRLDLTIRDSLGRTSTASVAIVVTTVSPSGPRASFSMAGCGQTGGSGGTIVCSIAPNHFAYVTFDGSSSSGGSASITRYEWRVAGGAPLGSGQQITIGFGGPTSWDLSLKIVTSTGQEDTAHATILVNLQ